MWLPLGLRRDYQAILVDEAMPAKIAVAFPAKLLRSEKLRKCMYYVRAGRIKEAVHAVVVGTFCGMYGGFEERTAEDKVAGNRKS